MSNKRQRVSNRKDNGRFLMLPYELITSEAYTSLSNKAVKCLVDIAGQYNGGNNGDLSCTLRIMNKLGWNSNSQLDAAKNEILNKGFIALSRQGGRNKCNLYAITWKPIDECKGKLDRPATKAALGYWKNGINPETHDRKLKSVPRLQGNSAPNRGLVTQNNNFAASY